jgi:hypothetical protein
VMALYLQAGLHESALESGLSLMTWVVAYGVSGMLYSLVPARFVNIVPAAGCVVIAAAFGGLATLHDAGVAFVTILGFAGLAFGLLSTALVNRLTENAPEELSANLSGVLSTTVPLTATIGVAIFGSIYFMQTAAGGPDAANRSFAYVCVLFGVAFVLAAAASQAAMREATR